MKPLGEMLSGWREAMGFSQAEAARYCGVSRQLWFQFESGEIVDMRVSTLLKLAKSTGIPSERLLAAADLQLQHKAEITEAVS